MNLFVKSLLVLSLLPLHSFSGEYDDEVGIYCSNKNDLSDGHWASVNYKYFVIPTKVSGKWLTANEERVNFLFIPSCISENIFVIQEKDYLKVKNACPRNFFSQPTSSITSSNWYLFAVKNNFGIRILPGHTPDCKIIPNPRVG
jgi:hypothetical protein